MNLPIVFSAVVVILIYSFVFHNKHSAKIREIAPKIGLAELSVLSVRTWYV